MSCGHPGCKEPPGHTPNWARCSIMQPLNLYMCGEAAIASATQQQHATVVK